MGVKKKKNLEGNAGGLSTQNHQPEGGRTHLWYLVSAIESRRAAKLECLVFGFERYSHQMCIAYRNVSTLIAFLAHFWFNFFPLCARLEGSITFSDQIPLCIAYCLFWPQQICINTGLKVVNSSHALNLLTWTGPLNGN